jgi:8-oxo-dGTP diphosphatase
MSQLQSSKRSGASIIFFNSSNHVLLFLRDDKPNLPYPNRWDLLGGGVEVGETPLQCIVREIKEEIAYTLVDPHLFRVTEFVDRTEHTFFQRVDFDIEKLPLNEGQRLKWFSEDEILGLDADAIAFGFRPILIDFFKEEP